MSFSTLDVKLSTGARAFLRTVRHAGGSLHLEQDWQRALASACASAGVLAFTGGTVGVGNAVSRVALTGKGYAYLDRLMRAH